MTVTPGDTSEMSFDLGPPEPVQTALILHVPAAARVQIAGREITKTGLRRVLTTQRLPAGKELPNLTVRVSLDHHGRTVSKEEQITLRGGRKHELTFEFDDAALARR